MSFTKPIHTIVLDAGPMLKNDPPISSLLAKAERLITVPSVIAEIKDATARSRVETTWMPFLELISPNHQSVKAVADFARRTGDLPVLSKPDLDVLAITYAAENQRNGLSNIRTFPGEQLPKEAAKGTQAYSSLAKQTAAGGEKPERNTSPDREKADSATPTSAKTNIPGTTIDIDGLNSSIGSLHVSGAPPNKSDSAEPDDSTTASGTPQSPTEDSDSEDWITPSNIQKHQAKDQNAAIPVSAVKPLEVACITTDFPMQNVLLSLNLGLLNSSLQRVRTIRTYVLRCHACFERTRDMTKQFCPRCGRPTLTRVSCSTNSRGEFKMHLKKNMQWNHRGDRYSIPKPVSGRANGKGGNGRGGGKGGWGQSLILAEDQKEYVRATSGHGRRKETDLMDQDYLPGILTGHRARAGSRPKIGAGRKVNSEKR
ncbi:MAG: hypothetical protein Q9179_005184 [Wetmoreana sp. 5 TL-2023]